MARHTRVDPEPVAKMAGRLHLGDVLKLDPLSGGAANTSYRMECSSGLYVLTVSDEKDEQELAGLAAVLELLQAHQFPSSPLIARDSLEGKPVLVKGYIEGSPLPRPSPDNLHQVGRLLARLHRLPVPKGVPARFPYGPDCFEEVAHLPGDFPAWLKAASKELRLPEDLPRGLVHGDLFWDNLLFHEDRLVALLDFEEACEEALVFDVGMALVGCCCPGGEVDRTAAQGLMEGYQSVRAFEPGERAWVITAARLAAASTAFWRFRQTAVRGREAPDYRKMWKLARSLEAARL